jgi:hypothetical protein
MYKEEICNLTSFKKNNPLDGTLDKIVLKKTRGITTVNANKKKE